MTHEQAYKALANLVGVRAAASNEGELRAHLAGCPVCVERLALLERTALALRLTAAAPTEAVEQRVLAIPGQNPRRRQSRIVRRMAPVAIAAATLASIAALTVSLVRDDAPVPASRFVAERTVALRPVRGDVTATVQLGAPSGQYRLVRLSVEGLPGKGGTFDLWFVGKAGAMRAGSFSPDGRGACVVDLTTSATEGWERITITGAGEAPGGPVLATS